MSRKYNITSSDLEYILSRYPHERAADIAYHLGISVGVVYRLANKHGVMKSDAFLQSAMSGRLSKLRLLGEKHWYKKGHVPVNKGKKMPLELRDKVSRTFFKKGHIPANKKPVGSLRKDVKDGYWLIKTAEPKEWEHLHRIIYARHIGPIPEGCIVIFKDKNPDNLNPNNLELITRAEHGKRNSIHRFPPEVVRAIQSIGALQRQINQLVQNEK